MATYDFSPLYRSTIGFDRLPALLAQAARAAETDNSYPPYNIEKLGEDDYRIVIALAGFSKDDVEIVQEQNQLFVRGKLPEPEGVEFLHRGIAGRSFERRFNLADFIRVTGASFDNGLLTIEMQREVPERLKLRQIEIVGNKPRTISDNDNAKAVA